MTIDKFVCDEMTMDECLREIEEILNYDVEYDVYEQAEYDMNNGGDTVVIIRKKSTGQLIGNMRAHNWLVTTKIIR